MVLNGFVALQGWLMVYFRHCTVSVFTLTLPSVSQRMSSHGMILLGGFHSHGGTPIVTAKCTEGIAINQYWASHRRLKHDSYNM